jgi:PASTA domain
MPDRWVNPNGWGPQQPGRGQASPSQPQSFLRRHPLAFFGGILLVLITIGAMLGSGEESPATAGNAATVTTSMQTLPTVVRTEATSSTSPPTTVAEVTVPELVGMRAGRAKSLLTDRGLRGSISYRTTARYPSGSVISQSRTAGGDVRRGATISLVIAKAPPVTSPPTTAPEPSPSSDCDPAYPGACLPPPPPDLDCRDIGHRVTVNHQYGDPHRLDADGDGVGCDSWG